MTSVLRFWESQTKVKKTIAVSSCILILGALFLFITVGLPQSVEINVDGQVLQVQTWQKTVEEVLTENQITIEEADLVVPDLQTAISNHQTIQITRAFPVEVTVGTEQYQIKTVSDMVEKVLAANNITVNPDDIVMPEMQDLITKENNQIEIIRVTYDTLEQERNIPFKTEVIDDNNAVQGIRRTVQSGREGQIKEEYQIKYHNGEEVARELVTEKVIREPVHRIVAQGTQPKVMVASRGGEQLRYKQVLSMSSTAYTHTGNRTYTGIKPHVGVVAVDPSVIPLGTKLYVDGYGNAVAADIGSAIKGNRIDVFLETRAEAVKWGRRTVKVYILE